MASVLSIIINVRNNASKAFSVLKKDITEADILLAKLKERDKALSFTGITNLITPLRSVSTNALLATSAFRLLGTELRRVGDSTFLVGTQLAKIGAVITVPVAGAVMAFASFEKIMQRVLAISGANTTEFKAMADEAKRLGASTEFSATQAAEGLVFLAQAGLSASESIAALEDTLNLATAGGIELSQAADLATNVLAGFRLEVEDLGKVNDVLAATSSSANTNIRELAEAFKVSAPIAASAGITIKETAAILGSLANNGIKGAEAGNAFKRMLVKIQAPTARSAATLQRLGISVDDASGKFRGMKVILEDLNKVQLNAADAYRIFGLHTVGVALAAVGSARGIGELTDKLKDIEGASNKMADTMRTGVTAEFNKMTSALNGAAIALGEVFAPVVNEVLASMASFFKSIETWVEGLGLFGTTMLHAVAIMGVLALALGAILIPLGLLIAGFGIAITALSPFIGWVIALGVAAEGTTLSMGLLATSMRLLGGGVILFTTSQIVNLVGAMYDLHKANAQVIKMNQEYQASLTKQIKALGDIARAHSKYKDEKLKSAKELVELTRDELIGYRDRIAKAQEYYLAVAKIDHLTASMAGVKPDLSLFKYYRELSGEIKLVQVQMELLYDKANGFKELSQASRDVIISFNALKAETGSTVEALALLEKKFKGGIINNSGDADVYLQNLKDLEKGLQSLVTKGDISFVQLQSHLNSITTKKTVEELNILKTVATDRLTAVTNSLQLVSDGIATMDNKGFENLKAEAITLTNSLNSITDSIHNNIEPAFDTLGITSKASLQATALEAKLAYDTIKDAGVTASHDMKAAFLAMALAQAKANQGLIEGALKVQLANEGIIPTIDGITNAQKELARTINNGVKPAFETLGITSQASLQAMALEAQQAFETIKQSGVSTPNDIKKAFLAMALSQAKANQGLISGALKYQLVNKGVVPTIDGIKKAISDLADKSKGKLKALGDAAKKAGMDAKKGFDEASKSIDKMGSRSQNVAVSVGKEWSNAWKAIVSQGTVPKTVSDMNSLSKAATEMSENATSGYNTITKSIDNGTISLGRLKGLTNNVGRRFKALDKSKLESLKGQIDSARDALISMTKSAKDTLSSLRSQLAGLNGDRLKQAALANEQKTLEIQGELALAKAKGNTEAVKALQEALSIQQQIYQVQVQQIQADEAQKAEQKTIEEAQKAKDLRLDARNKTIEERQLKYDAKELRHEEMLLRIQEAINHERGQGNEEAAVAYQQRLDALDAEYKRRKEIQELRDKKTDAKSLARVNFARGGYVKGVGTGTSDSIPANLSNGEFVVNAKTTSTVGVDYLYALQDLVRKGFKGLPMFNTGGKISGNGTGTSDSILARLSNGEFVINAKTVSHFGENFFNSLQSMAGTSVNSIPRLVGSGTMLPAFANGGAVGSTGTKQVEIKLNIGGNTAVGLFDETQANQMVDILESIGQVTA